MALGTEPPAVREFDERECWAYLQQHHFGRVAVGAGGDLAIYPVNYLADMGRIRFRTVPGAKLIELLLDRRVAFEIDGQGEDVAWSVLVKGTAEEIELSPDRVSKPKLPETPWVPGPRDAVVEITPVSMTGRVFTKERRAADRA